jgi:hypothetical protein
MEMRPMGTGSGAGKASGVRYTAGGREHTYGVAEGSDPCQSALSWCSVCGLSPTERQQWHGKLLGPIINLVKVNVGGGILAIPLTFRLW